MIFKWESEEEKLKRYMKIPPKAKMEWLYEINEFLSKTSDKSLRKIRHKMRNIN